MFEILFTAKKTEKKSGKKNFPLLHYLLKFDVL